MSFSTFTTFRQVPISFRVATRTRLVRPCSRPFTSYARPTSKWSAPWLRRGLFATISAAGAAAFFLHTSDKILLDAKPPAVSSVAKSEPETTRKDPSTGLEFPETLIIQSRVRLPPFQLLGLGARTVSFISLKVYSVAFYADLSSLKIPEDLSADEKIDYIVSNAACVLRILPTRNTSLSHLRDGFMRSIRHRMSSQMKEGTLSPEEAEETQSPLRKLKSMFPATPLHRGEHLDILLLPPPKNPGEKRTLVVRDLGSVESNWLAKEFFMMYFAGKGISPPMKDSVVEFLQPSRPQITQ